MRNLSALNFDPNDRFPSHYSELHFPGDKFACYHFYGCESFLEYIYDYQFSRERSIFLNFDGI